MPPLLAVEQNIVITLNQLALSSGFLLLASRFFAVIGILFVVGFFILSLFIDWSFLRIPGIMLFLEGALAALLAWFADLVIGLLFFRERPYAALSEVHSAIGETFTAKSFPSDHTALAFALAMVLTLHAPKIGVFFIVFAFLIAISRIVVGVHYPTDVIGGMIVGVASAFLIHKLIV